MYKITLMNLDKREEVSIRDTQIGREKDCVMGTVKKCNEYVQSSFFAPCLTSPELMP